jgi:hypothetical protein
MTSGLPFSDDGENKKFLGILKLSALRSRLNGEQDITGRQVTGINEI